MSFVVRIVGAQITAPALQPKYGTPASARSRTAASTPVSCKCFSRWNVLPPPTASASTSRTAAAGSSRVCTPSTETPNGARASHTFVT